MGRAPCCDKANVKKGPWSPEEDAKLKSYIDQNGTGGNWIALPQKIGLKRCGKSCRLRWLNYLRPNIKHGGFSDEEDRIICSLYGTIGSRWSIIAAQLPGRTDNDIKNYWNTRLKKKLLGKQRNTSNSGRKSKRTLLSDHHLHTNTTTIPLVLPNSTNFNMISNTTQLMYPYTNWHPIPATLTAATATTSNALPSCSPATQEMKNIPGGFGEMRSLLMKLEHQNMYYHEHQQDGLVNHDLHPPLITNHHQIENQMVNMMNLDGSITDLGGCLGQAFDATHHHPTFPRELEELMSSTSNPAAQRMDGPDQFLAWDQTVMINNNISAITAGSETSCGESLGSWCEMSSLISLPMGTGATDASCTEGIPLLHDHGFEHQLRYTSGN